HDVHRGRAEHAAAVDLRADPARPAAAAGQRRRARRARRDDRAGRARAAPHARHRRAAARRVSWPCVSEAQVQRTNPNVTLAGLSIAGIASALLQSLVAPALPDMRRELHCSESAVAWVLTAYLLSASVATPIIGRLGDIHGKERMLMIVLAVLAA